MKKIEELQALICHQFQRIDLLKNALAHPSFNSRNKEFERLEFLGDRVLGLCMAQYLFQLFPSESEGSLAKRQAVLVSKESCAHVAKSISLDQYIQAICDKGALATNMHSISADATEALLGALFLDAGLDACLRFVHCFWKDLVSGAKEPPKDAKSTLQEWLQKRGFDAPLYVETEVVGSAHEPIFTVSVTVMDAETFSGSGRSRRIAEQQAAKHAFDLISGKYADLKEIKRKGKRC